MLSHSLFNPFPRSLMSMLNSTGPRADSCGTPLVVSVHL